MQASYRPVWCFALLGAQYAPKASKKPAVLRRTLRHVGGQLIVSAFLIVDIGALGLAATASFWLVPWVTVNLAVLLLGTLSWNEDSRIRSESAAATQRQAGKVRAAKSQKLEEEKRAAQRQREAERLRQAEQAREREAHRRLAAALLETEEQVREAEQRRQQEQKQREKLRREQAEQAERLRQAEQQRREAEQSRRQAEEEREARKRRQREREWAAAQVQGDWWSVLGVAPSASKAEIVRNYRRKIKQCHPDRLAGLAPEFVARAEEQTKVLNGAYENALRIRG